MRIMVQFSLEYARRSLFPTAVLARVLNEAMITIDHTSVVLLIQL